jgi:sulfatase modifying factor 1
VLSVVVASLALATSPSGGAHILAGSWEPFFRDAAAASPAGARDDVVEVPAFFLDETAVTNADYAAFLRAHPEWRRSRIPRIFADAGYLKTWTSDVDPGPRNLAQAPVTEVSWFAAKAFCKSRGATLPTTAQWERASASLDETPRAQAERIVAWYGTPTPAMLPAVSSVSSSSSSSRAPRDLHGLIWEWVLDFNTAMTGDDGRSVGGSFCGAGADSARDPSDYATFMRYAFRASLKASYTTRNLGFRCARAEEKQR